MRFASGPAPGYTPHRLTANSMPGLLRFRLRTPDLCYRLGVLIFVQVDILAEIPLGCCYLRELGDGTDCRHLKNQEH